VKSQFEENGEQITSAAAIEKVSMLLIQAAQLSVALETDLDTFMARAYGAYLQANPELRDQLESMHLLAQLSEMRRQGKIAVA